MHDWYYDHGGIAKRQGLVNGLASGLLESNLFQTPSTSTNTGLLGLGSIIGGATSGLPPSQLSSQLSVPQTSTLFSSTVSSTPSLSSSSSSSLTTHSSPSPKPSNNTIATSSPSVTTSNGAPEVVTATAPVSSSSDISSRTGVPNSFFQNKPLEIGVFVVVGMVGVVVVVLLLTVWIRSNGRRKLDREALDAVAFNPSTMHGFQDDERGSAEKLTQWNSTSSAMHTHTTTSQPGHGAEYHQGGYPGAPLPLRTQVHPAGGYGQPSTYYGQLPQGMGNNCEHKYAIYALPRHPNPLYDPARALAPPGLDIIPATLNNDSHIGEVSPIITFAQNMPPQRRRSLSDSPPGPPATSSENKPTFSTPSCSHSKALDPRAGMQEMPVAPTR